MDNENLGLNMAEEVSEKAGRKERRRRLRYIHCYDVRFGTFSYTLLLLKKHHRVRVQNNNGFILLHVLGVERHRRIKSEVRKIAHSKGLSLKQALLYIKSGEISSLLSSTRIRNQFSV